MVARNLKMYSLSSIYRAVIYNLSDLLKETQGNHLLEGSKDVLRLTTDT